MKKPKMHPNSLANLRPVTKETAKIIGRKGGLRRTPAKKAASKLLRIKEGKGNASKHLQDLVTNPNYHALDVALFVEAMRKRDDLSFKDNVELAKLLLGRHKMLFGDKMQVEHKGQVEAVVVNIIDPTKRKKK